MRESSKELPGSGCDEDVTTKGQNSTMREGRKEPAGRGRDGDMTSKGQFRRKEKAVKNQEILVLTQM